MQEAHAKLATAQVHIKGPKGLSNLGNTCYLASVLQCLAQTPRFTQDLEDQDVSRLGGIGRALQVVLRQLRSENQGSVQDLLNELAERYSWYQGKSQQDAHELLRTLLSALTEEGSSREALQEMVQRSFKGQICEAILCWQCREIVFRYENFLDLSLDLSQDDLEPGPLGLQGWVMKPMKLEDEAEDEEPEELVEEKSELEIHDFLEVQLDRVPGRRIALGFDWQDSLTYGCKVLKGLHPNSMADLWNKRNGRRLVPGLLLMSVNDVDDEEEIMQVLKDSAKLQLKFVREEVMEARKQGEKEGFRIEVTKDASKTWGLQLDQRSLEDGVLIIAHIPPESALDAWNLRCQSTGRHKLVVHPGDRVTAVNGSDDIQQMTKAMNNQARQKMIILLEEGDRKGYVALKEGTEEDCFQVELQAMGSSWGFQLEDARVKGIDEASPLALWNMVCRSRGDEHFCVEVGDTLISELSAVSGTAHFTIRRSKTRQSAVLSALQAEQKAVPQVDLELQRLDIVRAAEACLQGLALPLSELFTAKPRQVACLADCARSFGSVEALEDSFKPIYHCAHCACKTFASKRTWLLSLPPVLPVQLKRFRCENGTFKKSRKQIRTSCTLDLQDLLLSAEEQPLGPNGILRVLLRQQMRDFVKNSPECSGASASYELYGVCAHLGGSMERGHYVAFINAGPSLQDAQRKRFT